MKFIPCLKEDTLKTTGKLFFIFNGDQLFIEKKDGSVNIPTQLDNTGSEKYEIQFIGYIDTIACYAGILISTENNTEQKYYTHLMSLFGKIDDSYFAAGCYGYHISKWNINSRYCGICGCKTALMDEERAKKCISCGNIIYPVIHPCIMVLVIKNGNAILLGKINRPGIDLYSVLAGYVEVGETLEECVRREVFEEAGIEIENIRYFASQPWVFSQSLMVAFIADYKSGILDINEKELPHADWFTTANLPKVPVKGTIAGNLIDWFVNRSDKQG